MGRILRSSTYASYALTGVLLRDNPPTRRRKLRVPELLPFRALRYTTTTDHVVAPPYDVIDADEHAALLARDPHNAVRLILPEGDDRYSKSAATLDEWTRDETLTLDETPSLYRYRMTFEVDAHPVVTDGVLGALVLPDSAPAEGAAPGPGDVLPHERTLHKAHTDRLDLLRATRANLDPIWGLSLHPLTVDSGELLATVTDLEGVHHEIFRLDDTDVAREIALAPLVLADGHHRYEVARAYRAEQDPTDVGACAVLAFVAELSPANLAVEAIHRGFQSAVDLRARLARHGAIESLGDNEPDLLARARATQAAEGGVLIVDANGLARAALDDLDDSALPPALRAIDTARLELALDSVAADISYRHDAATVAALVSKGALDAAVLMLPVPVDTIRDVALAGLRMPQKTTYFRPKPRTGMAFRRLDDHEPVLESRAHA